VGIDYTIFRDAIFRGEEVVDHRATKQRATILDVAVRETQ
jgi:hypothetical protein